MKCKDSILNFMVLRKKCVQANRDQWVFIWCVELTDPDSSNISEREPFAQSQVTVSHRVPTVSMSFGTSGLLWWSRDKFIRLPLKLYYTEIVLCICILDTTMQSISLIPTQPQHFSHVQQREACMGMKLAKCDFIMHCWDPIARNFDKKKIHAYTRKAIMFILSSVIWPSLPHMGEVNVSCKWNDPQLQHCPTQPLHGSSLCIL